MTTLDSLTNSILHFLDNQFDDFKHFDFTPSNLQYEEKKTSR